MISSFPYDDDNDDEPSAHHHRDIFSQACHFTNVFITLIFFTSQLMAHRVKNDATVDEVASLFRELHPHGNCDALCISESIECFLEAHCELICRLLGLTLRPTGLLVERALKEAFNDPPETLVASFSRLLVRAVSRAREVSRSMKTGRRLNPVVARIVASLSRTALGKSARKLKARISAASDTSALMVLEDALRIATDVLDVSSGSDLEEMRTPVAPSRLDILAV